MCLCVCVCVNIMLSKYIISTLEINILYFLHISSQYAKLLDQSVAYQGIHTHTHRAHISMHLSISLSSPNDLP